MTTDPQPTRSDPSELWSFLRRERVVIALLATTFALLAWQHWGMTLSLHFDRQSKDLLVTAVDDKYDKGNSICRVDTIGDEWRLDYDVRPGGDWAYCGINFAFCGKDSSRGIDLSRFQTIVANLAGMTGPNTSLQVQMKSKDPGLQQLEVPTLLKFQDMVLQPVGQAESRTSLPLDFFVIPPWWAARFHVPANLQNPHRRDVREIEFMTSADIVRLGKGTVRFRALEFHGKWIDQARLLKLLFIAWLSYILGGLVLRLYKSLGSIRALQSQTSELQDLAERDPLTRLHNRRGLENQLNGLANQFLDPTNPVIGVVMIDLDHFKTVNDTLGHDAGDEILRILSRIILDEMRPKNLAARWGGEEFILLFPGISKPRLQPVAEKLRARIEAELHYKDMRITASIGIAHGDVADFDALTKRADEALYRAKATGRNRVEVADPI
jgi:diguanylate cyclase (GGDEF)-like protein